MCSQKYGIGGLNKFCPTKISVLGVTEKTRMITRNIADASFLWPVRTRPAIVTYITPGRKSNPRNLSGFQGANAAMKVPTITEETAYGRSKNNATTGRITPPAVMLPGMPIVLEIGMSRKTAYTAANVAVRESFRVLMPFVLSQVWDCISVNASLS